MGWGTKFHVPARFSGMRGTTAGRLDFFVLTRIWLSHAGNRHTISTRQRKRVDWRLISAHTTDALWGETHSFTQSDVKSAAVTSNTSLGKSTDIFSPCAQDSRTGHSDCASPAIPEQEIMTHHHARNVRVCQTRTAPRRCTRSAVSEAGDARRAGRSRTSWGSSRSSAVARILRERT